MLFPKPITGCKQLYEAREVTLKELGGFSPLCELYI